MVERLLGTAEQRELEGISVLQRAICAICLPSLLAATVLYYLEHTRRDIAEQIKGNIYVDIATLEVADVKEGKEICKKAKEIFAVAKMNRREFIASSTELNEWLPEEDRQKVDQTKVLGLQWDTEKSLSCKSESKVTGATQRGIS